MALMVWIISGVFSMVGAYCYAELGCMIKKTGADYAYIMVSFGPFLAFIRLWVECIIVRPCSQAIVALTFSIYACKPFFPECDPPDESVRLLAAICICEYSFIFMGAYKYPYIFAYWGEFVWKLISCVRRCTVYTVLWVWFMKALKKTFYISLNAS